MYHKPAESWSYNTRFRQQTLDHRLLKIFPYKGLLLKNIPLKLLSSFSSLFSVYKNEYIQTTFTGNLSLIQYIISHLNEEKEPPQINLLQTGT